MTQRRFAAVLFDMFDTLVRLDRQRLPVVRIGDREVRSSAAILHALVPPALAGTSLADFHAAFAWSFQEAERLRSVAHREVSATERFRLLYRRLGVDPDAVPPDTTVTLLAAHGACLTGAAEPMPGLEGLLAWLDGRYRLGIVSNFDHTPTVHRILERAGIQNRFEAVVVSDAVGWRKPKPAIFREALDRLGLGTADCLFVGDRLDIDVAGARSIGMAVAWLNVAGAPVPPGMATPDFDVPGLADLRPILDGAPHRAK
jgi:HAD superfamily hydrolase (TIGR01509 family)